MGYISKLDAVNNMMLAAGESLVADLEEASGIDTGIAVFILEQTSLDYQLRGLANNKIVKKLTPDSDGYIYLPMGDGDEDGLISANLLSSHYNDDSVQLIARILESVPPKLWNITDDTDKWDTSEEYYVEIIKKLKWENIDTTTQRSIMTSAMRNYQIATQGDGDADAFFAGQEAIYGAKAKASDINSKRRNIFLSGDPVVRNSVNRVPFSNDPARFRFWRTS